MKKRGGYSKHNSDNHHIRNNNDSFHDHCYCSDNHGKRCGCRCHNSPVSIILRKTIGFVIFVILLSVAGIISQNLGNSVYSDVIQFFNSNISLFLILFFMGMASEIFWNFSFPVSMLAPVISSVLSIFVVNFFYRIWLFIEGYVSTNFPVPINAVSVAVFILTLLIGYLVIVSREARWRYLEGVANREERKEPEMKNRAKEKKETAKKTRKMIDWKEVGNEFRLVFYNLGKEINNAFEKKTGRKGGRK